MESAPGSVGPLVVKLGGSVITRKREAERVRPKILRRLSEEVSSVADTPMVLLHGAGSFGHPGAASSASLGLQNRKAPPPEGAGGPRSFRPRSGGSTSSSSASSSVRAPLPGRYRWQTTPAIARAGWFRSTSPRSGPPSNAA